MKKFLLSCILVSFFSFSVNGQILIYNVCGKAAFESVEAEAAIKTADGGYILAGKTSSIDTLNGDAYLIRIDLNHDTIWTRIIGGPSLLSFSSVCQDANGNFVALGHAYNQGTGLDLLVSKTDSLGYNLWTKAFGNSSSEYPSRVIATSDGNFILTGYTYGPVNEGIFLIKLNPSGDTLWTKIYSAPYSAHGFGVVQNPDGGYTLAGMTVIVNNQWDIMLINVDSMGALNWAHHYGGLNVEEAFWINRSYDGGYIVTGSTESFGAGGDDVYLLRLDDTGNILWAKTYGGPGHESGYYVSETSDSGFICAGYTNGFGAGMQDGYVIKTNSNGDTVWTKTYGWTNNQELFYITPANYGYQAVGECGYGFSSFMIDSNGYSGCYDGYPSTTVSTVIMSTGTLPINLYSGFGIYFPATYIASGVGCQVLCFVDPLNVNQEHTIENLIFPNPATDYINVRSWFGVRQLEIFNLWGKQEAAFCVGQNKRTFDITDLSPGIYYVKVYLEKGNEVLKLIKQ
jgi:hypothetical protein